jgi:fructokinase
MSEVDGAANDDETAGADDVTGANDPSGADDVIVVAGEALVDLVPDADGGFAVHAGGGPFNAARTLGRLARPVAFLGRLSTDRLGGRLREALVADGVALVPGLDTAAPTTLAVAEVDPAGTASYGFYTEGTSAPGLTPDAALDALPGRVSMLHVGTLGLVLEPIAHAIEAVVERVAGSGLVLIDLNCRPAAITDEASYRARLGRLLRRCDVVKASYDDLAWLRPELPRVDAARGLFSAGPDTVLVTRGADGAIAMSAAAETEIPAPPVQVVDTIGAGDAFGAAFLAWWHRAGLGVPDLDRFDAVEEAARFATLVATRTCVRAGAAPPRLADLAMLG